MAFYRFTNFEMLDPEIGELRGGHDLLVEGETIREVSAKPLRNSKAETVNCGGRTLMPGLIDSHVHVCASAVNLASLITMPEALVAFRAAKIMKGMLDRGFTTVRDVGGGHHALVEALEEGLIEGPRLFTSGKALSQTGGHSDARTRYDMRDTSDWAGKLGRLGRLCDGVPEVRKACREELKQGAHFIKIMANGGVASPNDPIHFLGFSREEIIAAVEEARNAGTYVSAHLYTDEAIARAVECGVHSLEHCNLISEKTAKAARKAGAVACPTLVTYEYLKSEGASLGLPPVSVAKVDTVRLSGMKSLEIIKKAGLPMAFGTDLLGEMHKYQSEEFVIRARVLPAAEILRSATLIGAELVHQKDKLGCLKPGAYADLLLVDGNPLANLALLTEQGKHLAAIMKGGRFYKNRLN